MIQKIKNCYDSHVHFLATGQVVSGLKLQDLSSELAVQQINFKPEHYRSDWITGFGWDQNKWNSKKFPHKKTLDQIFPETPVLLSRVDGHTSWVNTKAIQQLTMLGYDFTKNPTGGVIERDEQGQPTGILIDQAHITALMKLPEYNEMQNRIFAENAQNIFNRAGFTHVRDLSMNLTTWNLLSRMAIEKKLTVCIDSFVTVENLADLPRAIEEVSQMKKNPSDQLRIHGIKLFVDGSLGSKTAFLSQNYLNSSNRGFMSWNVNEIKEALRIIWQADLEVAVHTIGDEAVHIVVLAAREISAEGILGRLHLEHVQIIRPETIKMMKPLHITCHMQPCHWLSDHEWLPSALPETLLKNLFPWESLRKNKIPFDFGSDAPIEVTSFFRNQSALAQSAQAGIPQLQDDWKNYHSHPDSQWTASWTEFDENKIQQVYFNGQALFKTEI